MLRKDANGALGLYCHEHQPEFASSVGGGGLLGPLPPLQHWNPPFICFILRLHVKFHLKRGRVWKDIWKPLKSPNIFGIIEHILKECLETRGFLVSAPAFLRVRNEDQAGSLNRLSVPLPTQVLVMSLRTYSVHRSDGLGGLHLDHPVSPIRSFHFDLPPS